MDYVPCTNFEVPLPSMFFAFLILCWLIFNVIIGFVYGHEVTAILAMLIFQNWMAGLIIYFVHCVFMAILFQIWMRLFEGSLDGY
ncbi:hypothetical protein ACFLZN_01640 [Nanoarchaeota archaeon]